jgi:hypothetical protein
VERHSKMAYAFFFRSDQPLGDFAAIASQWVLHSYIFNWKNQTFRADLILILPIAFRLGIGLCSSILLLEESQPAPLNRVLTNPTCCRCCLSCRVVSV